MSNLQLRVISSIALAVIALSITWLGGVAFRVLAGAIALAIIYEWSRMSVVQDAVALKIGSGAMLAIAMIGLVLGYPADILIASVGAAAAVSLVFGVVTGQGSETAISLVYAGMAGISLAFLRDSDTTGLLAILFLFAVVWATDIFAYFVGRTFGGAKLAPSISPGKTWSGAIGGTVGGIVAGIAVALAAGFANGVLLAVVAFLLSVVSQLGDLFESGVKRRHGAKDSGTMIPGHGGVMDRVDGLVAAAFALYLIGAATGGMEHPAHSLFAR